MRFTSLVIELIRARPQLVVWLVVLLQAALWLILPLLLYRSPPGDVATVAGLRPGISGRNRSRPARWRFWLGDNRVSRRGQSYVRRLSAGAALRGSRRSGRYICWRVSIVGGQHAVLAVLLTMTVTAFGSSSVEFGPLVLARPLWGAAADAFPGN